jgi:hypothetical protein
MPVGVALVGAECTVGKARVTPIHLLREGRLQSRPARGVRGVIVVLHSEEVRGQDEAVPRVLR